MERRGQAPEIAAVLHVSSVMVAVLLHWLGILNMHR
jgi:hypothetical protein